MTLAPAGTEKGGTKMKTKSSVILTLASVWALLSPLTPARDLRVDLSIRRAIYITKSKTSIDLKGDRYVDENRNITLNKRQAESCQGNNCTFNLGIIAIKSGGTSTLSTYGQYTGAFGIVGNTITFSANESTKQQVLPVALAVGKNTVTFTIDPQKKIAETDEANNSVTVTIVVE
jgi:hypothetical protein